MDNQKKRKSSVINSLKKVTGIGKTIEDEEFEKAVNLDFVNLVGPQGGINFDNEKFTSTGNGYEACLYIYGYKHEIDYYWLLPIVDASNTVTVIDIATVDKNMVKQNLSKTMEEQSSRMNTAKSHSEFKDAAKQFQETESMYEELSMYSNVMKAVIIRIYVPARTIFECDDEVAKIKESLEGSGYKLAVCINETKEDFRNAFLSYSQQQKTAHKRKGQGMLSTTLAIGNPFHYTSLSDPYGFYYGETDTGGSVLLDMYRITQKRNSYNGIICGMMGSGKSTLLKKMLLERTIRGDYSRVFDVTGEFKELVEFLGGSIIPLSGGSAGKINALQILRTGEDDRISYNAHMSKVATIYKYLKPDASTEEVLVLKKLLRFLYISKGIVNSRSQLKKPLENFKTTDFPTWSDLLELCKQSMVDEMINSSNIDIPADSLSEDEKEVDLLNLSGLTKKYVQNIELMINDIVSQYGEIFDGHTSIEDFSKEQIVVFDCSDIVNLEATIFDALIFQAITLCSDNCYQMGKIMKDKFDHKEIAWNDIIRTTIFIDEAHRFINTSKPDGVMYITTMERELRKWFSGIYLATQSIRDFVPDGSTSDAVDKLKTLFELSTYKWIMNQDSNAKKKLLEIFDGVFTDAEIKQVPNLTKGEVLLSAGGETTLQFMIDVSEQELSLFAGGA